MKITTTKKIKGALELPSIGVQLHYDHIKGKPQVMVIDDKHFMNNDIQIASGMNFITIEAGQRSEEAVIDDDGQEQPQTVLLTNLTNNPIIITIDGQKVEIPAKRSSRLPETVLENAHIKESIVKKMIQVKEEIVNEEEASIEETKATAYDLDEEERGMDDEEKINEHATTPVVANPNNEKTIKTDRSIKKINARKPRQAKKVKRDKTPKETVKVYSPEEVVDDPGEKEDLDFVDKEQEKERIASLKRNTSATKAVQTEALEGTTPTVVKRVSQKAAKNDTEENKGDIFELE